MDLLFHSVRLNVWKSMILAAVFVMYVSLVRLELCFDREVTGGVVQCYSLSSLRKADRFCWLLFSMSMVC